VTTSAMWEIKTALPIAQITLLSLLTTLPQILPLLEEHMEVMQILL
jgi:hypothetical protein